MGHWQRALIAIAAVVIVATATLPATAQGDEGRSGRSTYNATWLSIGHPGLGEWYLKGWGSFWDRAPQKKFWLGFIPLYGWPGYLQVKSARDGHRCRTNDNLGWND